MAKTELEKLAINVEAARKAKSLGQTWAALTVEERQRLRQHVFNDDHSATIRELERLAVNVAALRLAESQGRAFKELPPDEQQKLKKEASGAVTENDRAKAAARLART